MGSGVKFRVIDWQFGKMLFEDRADRSGGKNDSVFWTTGEMLVVNIVEHVIYICISCEFFLVIRTSTNLYH